MKDQIQYALAAVVLRALARIVQFSSCRIWICASWIEHGEIQVNGWWLDAAQARELIGKHMTLPV
ncbi:MAG: hypothetical protein A2W25_15500 [candidate division Zixibacteria bacterium RBG_16_53_22]|nr:MAG: hypothetical protein A2W25_15500 [candidate division Zixibacteria bacterium RBG_16_53_22]